MIRQKRKSRPLFDTRWVRVLGTVFILAVFFGNRGFLKLVNNWMELRSLNGEVAGLRLERKELRDELEGVRAGDSRLERMARRELGYMRPGEIEYRFPPPSSGD